MAEKISDLQKQPLEEEEPPSQSKLALARTLAPQLPNFLLKSAAHFLQLTPTSEYWDLRTTLTVEFLRNFLNQPNQKPSTIEETQALTTRPVKVEPNTWKVDISIPVSDATEAKGVEAAVYDAIVAVGGKREDILPVGCEGFTAEWIGNRTHHHTRNQSHHKAKQQNGGREGGRMNNQDKYNAMMQEVEGGEEAGAALYLHGGAYFLCDPNTHRPVARKTAKSFKGRSLLYRYRLAPQNPFPAALIDSLVAYLYLLYPPPGAYHAPIPASKIVFAGDSAGGGLGFCLLQLLRVFQKNDTKLIWQGQTVSVPMPAGMVGISPWVDVTRCFGGFGAPDLQKRIPGGGSEEHCGVWDYLPTVHSNAKMQYKESPGWNPGMGRKHLYGPDSLLTNPLLSPLAADGWDGCPPVWSCCGDELLRDSNLYLVHRLRTAGLRVHFEKYRGMPHVFAGLFPHTTAARNAWESVGRFIRGALKDAGSIGDEQWNAFKVHPQTLKMEKFKEEELSMGFTIDEVRRMMNESIERWGKDGQQTVGGEAAGGGEGVEAVVSTGETAASRL